MEKQERILYFMLSAVLVVSAAAAVLYQGASSAVQGFLLIQQHPARLINDYVQVGGGGGALLNAVSVAAISLALIWFVDVKLSGPTIAAFFTIMGFGLFGKTPLNILPIIIGVYIASKIAGKTFSEYILIALFGTALGPLATYIVVEFASVNSLLPSLILGTAGGIAAGIVLPAAAISMLHLHQGYNLYNMGFTCGFVGLFAAGLLEASGGNVAVQVVWFSGSDALMYWITPVLSGFLIIFGILLEKLWRTGNGRKRHVWKDLLLIQKRSGRLPDDFMDNVSNGGGLLNTGILGFLSWFYVIAVGGDFNGPVLGGILTIIGFGVFGKHIRNCIPVVAGVVVSCLIFGFSLSAPGPILAALFGTTLAPLAGEFGAHVGVAAGFIHLFMVVRTAAWHGGIDLYNNGFSGGLTAAMMFAVIEWYRSTRPDDFPRRRPEDVSEGG